MVAVGPDLSHYRCHHRPFMGRPEPSIFNIQNVTSVSPTRMPGIVLYLPRRATAGIIVIASLLSAVFSSTNVATNA